MWLSLTGMNQTEQIMKRKVFDGWVSVFESGSDYEAEIVGDRLKENGLDVVVLSKRDHAFNLNVGAASGVYVLVQPGFELKAINILRQHAPTDEELTTLALASNPENVDPPNREQS